MNNQHEMFNVISVTFTTTETQEFHPDREDMNEVLARYAKGELRDDEVAEYLGLCLDDCEVEIGKQEKVKTRCGWVDIENYNNNKDYYEGNKND